MHSPLVQQCIHKYREIFCNSLLQNPTIRIYKTNTNTTSIEKKNI